MRFSKAAVAARTHAPRHGRAPSRRERKLKALLAGGLVFGLGSTATLASWIDLEQTDGSFGAGIFKIETSVGGTWGTAASMEFNAASMYPGQITYAPVMVRTSSDTTYEASLQVAGGGLSASNALGDALAYRTVVQRLSPAQAPGFICNATNFSGTPDFVFGGPSNLQPLKDPAISSSGGSLAPAAGDVLAYCFEVRLPLDAPNTAQGQSVTHTWSFTGESVIPAGAG